MKKTILLWVVPVFLIVTAVAVIGSGCNGMNPPTPQPSSGCLSGSLANGVIAFYNFSNGSLNDTSGNNRHLTAVGSFTPTTDRSGTANCAVKVINQTTAGDIPSTGPGNLPQGTTNHFLLPNLNSGVTSISLWYQPIGTYNPLPSPLGSGRLLGGYEGLIIGSTSTSASLAIADTCGEWSLGLYDCRRANVGVKLTSGSYWEVNTDGCDTFLNAMSNQWKHAVIIKNGSTLSLYINGVYQAPNSFSFDTAGNFGATVTNLLIGYGFKGSLDDLILYNRALTPTEVGQLYAFGGCCQ